MKRTELYLAITLAACHSVGISVERKSSGSIEIDHQFVPERGVDKHFISLPAHPFVNCVDAVQLDHDVRRPGKPLHDERHAVPCATSNSFGFVGYRKEDITKGDTYKDAVVSWLAATKEHEELRERRDLADLAKALTPGVNDVTWPVALFSFLHFSDAQIREPEAKLTNAEASRQLDQLISSFERDYEQELYARFVYSALVDTANKELGEVEQDDRPKPQFMIHTGDSVDAGLVSEFDEFRRTSDQLQIPWFQAVGNHDILAFGNLRLLKRETQEAIKETSHAARVESDAMCSIDEPECTCTQVADLVRYMLIPKPDNLGRTGPPNELPGAIPALLKRICIRHRVANDRFVMDPRNAGDDATSAFLRAQCERVGGQCLAHAPAAAETRFKYPIVGDPAPCAELESASNAAVNRSQLHGFDLASNKLSPYYCFQIQTSDESRKAWAVVLNTSAKTGAYGALDEDQLCWLDALLPGQRTGGQLEPLRKRCAARPAKFAKTNIGDRDLVLAFGHHPLWDFHAEATSNTLVDVLASSKNVVAYFGGHTHTSQLRVVHPRDKRHVPDLENDPSPRHHFWEVIAPSVIDHPLQGRQVTVKTMGATIGYIEVLSFAPHGTGPSEEKIRRAQTGAKRDYCASSSRCVKGEPRSVSRTVTYPRLFFRLP